MTKRYTMWTLAVFSFALLLCTYLSFRVMIIVSLSALLALIPLVFIKVPLKKLLIPCMISLILSVLFFGWSSFNVARKERLLLDQSAYVTGAITDVGTNSSGSLTRYCVQLSTINEERILPHERFNVYVYIDDKVQYTPGSVVGGTFSFFDSAVEYGRGREDRVFASAYVGADQLKQITQNQNKILSLLYHYKTSVMELLRYGNDKTIGLLRSVCFGETTSLDSGMFVSLRRIGMSHVTAVSGLHLSFAVLLFDLLASAFGMNHRIRHLLDIVIAILFTALVGFPYSCVRACIMLCIFSLGVALNLFSDSITSLSVAAFVILVFNPFAVRDVGFLLSVSATAGIVLLYAPIENFLFPKKLGSNSKINGIYRKFTGIFACSVAASIATLPVVLPVFRSVSLIGPLANVVLLLPMQAVFIIGMLMILVGWIPGVGFILGLLCDLLCGLIDIISNVFGRVSFASVSGFDFMGVVLLVLFFGILAVALYDFLKHKRRCFMALFLLLLVFAGCFGIIYRVTDVDDPVRIAFIDVGQGDCTIVSKGQKALIFDCGGDSDRRYNVIEYLRKNGIYEVDLLAFTHLHSDHSNGLKSLLNNLYIDEIIYPDCSFDSLEQKAMLLTEGARNIDKTETLCFWDDVFVTVMANALFDPMLADENELCVGYKITYGETAVLVAGDANNATELKLMENDVSSTILKVSHHGSKSSSYYPFIKAVSPDIAVISVGENNYGLPNESVINRLETICPLILYTKDGTIVFHTDGTHMERIR